MAIHDFTSQRLFVDSGLTPQLRLSLTSDQANYLRNVLRVATGSRLLVFNGRDGEWQATVEHTGKRDVTLVIAEQTRPQSGGPDIHYLFAPLKRSRLDYMVQKATELGVAALQPVLTQRTIADRVNLDRMRANAIEAAEQCGILRIPTVAEPQRFDRLLDTWPSDRHIVFCDEAATGDPLSILNTLPAGPLAVIVGPEGGFTEAERARITGMPCATALSLGPRIMRADTAAVAVLALVNATRGDWRHG